MVYNMKYKKKLVGDLFRFVLIFLFSDEKNLVGLGGWCCYYVILNNKNGCFCFHVHFIITSICFLVFFMLIINYLF